MLLSPRAGLSTTPTTVHASAWHALRPLRPARTFPLSPSNVDPLPPPPQGDLDFLPIPSSSSQDT